MSQENIHPFGDRHALCWPPVWDDLLTLDVPRLRATLTNTVPGIQTILGRAYLDFTNGTIAYSDRVEVVAGMGIGKLREVSLGQISNVEADDLPKMDELLGLARLRLSLRNNDEIVIPLTTTGQLWWPRDYYNPLHKSRFSKSSALIASINFYKEQANHPSQEDRIDAAINWVIDTGLIDMYQHWKVIRANQNPQEIKQFVAIWHNQGKI